jgi:MFS family permease
MSQADQTPPPGADTPAGAGCSATGPGGAQPDGPALPAAAVPPDIPLGRNGGFRLLWIGQILSDIGSEIGFLAYPLLILSLTGSPVLAGAVGTARSVALFLLRLPAGALADRLDRRLTMITCDVLRTVLLALLGLLVLLHAAAWPVVGVVSLLDGAANAIFDPAAMAALPAIVPDGQLEQAFAATEARQYTASLIGPALGGLLFGLARAVPFLADAASYAVSFGTVSRIRGRFRPEPAERKRLWAEVVDGLRLVWQVPLLRAVVVQSPLINFGFNGVIFAVILALRQHGTRAAVIGLVLAGVAAGGVIGAVVASRLPRRLPLSGLVIVVTSAAAVLFAAAALLVPSPLVALPVAASFLLTPAANAALFAQMQRRTPEHMRGRVNNTVIMVASALASLAPLVAGLLVQHVSGHWAVGCFAAVMVVAALLSVLLPGIRNAESAAGADG